MTTSADKSQVEVCKHRRWPRRWSWALVLVMLLGALVAFSSRNHQPSSAELRAELQGLNIGVENGETMCPAWLHSKLPEPLRKWSDERRYVTGLHGSTNVTDAHLAQWTKLARLRNLSAPFSQVSDAGLEHVEDMPSLIGLFLTGTAITDKGLVHVRQAVHLKQLNLNDTTITDVGLMHLSGLPDLSMLNIANTQVTDAGVAEFQRLNPHCRIKR